MTAETVEIQLTRGEVALIDAADLPLISRFHWHGHKNAKNQNVNYALATLTAADAASIGLPARKRSIKMHRLLMGFPDSLVDHRDGNGLNNCRHNLRLATHAQNTWNSRKYSCATTSRFKGVSLHRKSGKWQAFICSGGRNRYLGSFDCEEAAAAAYDAAALEHFGEFARPNLTEVA